MIDFLNKDKDESSTQDNSPNTAPGTQIYYHPDLIEELMADHQALISLAGRIKQTYIDGVHTALPDMLKEFGNLLRSHLLKENIKLYVYLQHVLANDEENATLMHEFRSEMKDIGRKVSEFLRKYTHAEWNADLLSAFGNEFDGVLEVLGKRIKMEETVLYTLYLPPEAYR